MLSLGIVLKIRKLRSEIAFIKGDMAMGGPDRSEAIEEYIREIRELESKESDERA